MTRRGTKLVLGSVVAGLALGFAGIQQDSSVTADVSDVGLLAATYWDIDVGEESDRRVLRERYREDYQRSRRIQRQQVPTVRPVDTSAVPERPSPEACNYHWNLVKSLKPKVIDAIPGAKQELTSVREAIEQIFDEAVRSCPEPVENVPVTDPQVRVIPVRVLNSDCDQYSPTSRRAALCRANKMNNQLYLGGQRRLQRIWQLQQQ